MPHIHTKPNQFDITTSAYIIRKLDNEWRCLLHFHKKLFKLLQVGGHIELDETPWRALEHELQEESGYEFADLQLLQPRGLPMIKAVNAVAHPIPFRLSTHQFADQRHYHTDIAYAFVASAKSARAPLTGESQDIRWYSLDDINTARQKGTIVLDVASAYESLISSFENYEIVNTVNFSTDKLTK